MSRGERNRTFYYAILASLALHALLLFGLPDLISSARHAASLPPKIIARLMAPEPVPVPAPPPQPPAQAAPPEPPKKKPPAPVIAKRSPERPVQVDPAPAAVPAPPADPQPPQAAAEAVAPAPAAAPPAASVQAVEEQSADRYRMELIEVLKSLIKESYPPLARDNNWEGDVRLGIELRADGRLSVTVKRSSRFGVLDQSAITVMRKAAEQVPVPPALRGKESTLRDLVVEYRLTD